MLDALLSELKQKQIKLWLEDGKLKFRAPPNALDPQLKSRLVENKPQIIEFLSQNSASEPHPLSALNDFIGQKEPVLSFAQQRILFMKQLEPESTAFHMPVSYRLEGNLDLARLQQALDEVVGRQVLTRTRFSENAVKVQPEPDEQGKVVIDFADATDSETPLDKGLEIAKQWSEKLFNLSDDFAIRLGVVKLGDDDYLLQLVCHHVICDGPSLDLFFMQLSACYDGQGASLEPLVLDYFDYAAWQRGHLESHPSFKKQLGYWQNQLSDAPALMDLATDRSRPPVQDLAGATLELPVPEFVNAQVSQFCREHTVTPYVFYLTVFNVLLSRYGCGQDIVVGTPATNRQHPALESLVGLFMNNLAIRTRLDAVEHVTGLLQHVKQQVLDAHANQDVPFEQVVDALKLERTLSYTPIFQVLFNHQVVDEAALSLAGLKCESAPVTHTVSKYDLSLSVQSRGKETSVGIEYATALFDRATVERMGQHYIALIQAVIRHGDSAVADLPLADEDQLQTLLQSFNDTKIEYTDFPLVTQWIAESAQTFGDKTALVCGDETLDYQTFWQRVLSLSCHLQQAGVKRGDIVAIMLDRSIDMVAALVATMYTGAAYLPVDPAYPLQRQRYILEDAKVGVVVTRTELKPLVVDPAINIVDVSVLEHVKSAEFSDVDITPQDIAYVIYTSGSTGNPKGVKVDHSNVTSFLRGLDERMCGKQPANEHVWLAVTSISFDISVLELLWTLARGAKVIVQPELPPAGLNPESPEPKQNAACADFSLFYFASAATGQAYDMLLDGARFADENGLKAVWVPERHFHDFGGQFANPSVAAAAVAAVTKNIDIRSGSVVLPIHHPVRVTEEWSMVDNLSNGRVGMAFASGWHFNDFVFYPENYENRFQVMRDNIEIVKALWRGEKRSFTAGNQQQIEVGTMPRPIQKELPVWITAAVNLDTFKYAGSIGANVLTHLLGHSVEELAEKIAAYRQARADNGFDPDEGKVTLMLHTFVGDSIEEIKATVEVPFKNYLRTSVNLLKPVAESNGLKTDANDEVLIEAGFQRYFATSALFGTPDSCMEMVQRLNKAGVSEIACLVDFGIDKPVVLKHFDHIRRLMANARAQAARDWLVGAQLERYRQPETLMSEHKTSHMQCTPSYLRMLMQRPEGKAAVNQLSQVCVGGEALPAQLAEEVLALNGPELLNMYGPTETTVWSAVKTIEGPSLIGNILTNEQIYILDQAGHPAPIGVPGEMFIGGDGVTQGYLERPSLTADRFVPDPFRPVVGARMYRTGDKARFLSTGDIEFLGRLDNQIKLRGYRIELQEIASTLEQLPQVKQAVVKLVGQSNKQIVAYVVANHPELKGEELNPELASKIPDYMMPNAYIMLDELPLTPNGKIDSRRLPDVASLHADKTKALAPRNELETKMVQLWQEILELPQVGIEDNFFDLGGNSFLLGELFVRIEALIDTKLPLIELFKRPTIAKLAAYLQGKEQVKKPLKTQTESRQKAVRGHREKLKQKRRR